MDSGPLGPPKERTLSLGRETDEEDSSDSPITSDYEEEGPELIAIEAERQVNHHPASVQNEPSGIGKYLPWVISLENVDTKRSKISTFSNLSRCII